MKNTVLTLLFVFFSSPLFAQIHIVTTLPDIAEMAELIGGDKVKVQSLLTGQEDPHFAEARPDYILKLRRADIVCSMGLDLEIGWLPKVLKKSGNAKVQTSPAGNCVLGQSVQARDIPTGTINRALGDVHPHGNPHFNLDPLKMIEASNELVRVLAEQTPESVEFFKENQKNFAAKMQALHKELQGQIKANPVMEYHQEFSYFFASYGLQSLGSIEEKPGMPPSAARIASVAKMAKDKGVKVVFASPSAPHRVLERFTELSGIPVHTLPSYVQKKGAATSIESLQKLLVESL